MTLKLFMLSAACVEQSGCFDELLWKNWPSSRVHFFSTMQVLITATLNYHGIQAAAND